MREQRYECRFCGTKFQTESRFLKHRCKQMIRDEEFRTPVGQSAWLYYQNWMKAYRRQIPKASAFLHSKFYNSFVRFAKFVKQVNLPDIDLFIWLMKEKDISPTLWVNDQVYSIYLEFIDHKGDPLKQTQITINTIFDIADAAECEPSEVFGILTPAEVIHFLRTRRMSPWVLLHSDRFMDFFVHQVSPEERIIMGTIIRPEFWSEKFANNPEAVNAIKKYISELNL